MSDPKYFPRDYLSDGSSAPRFGHPGAKVFRWKDKTPDKPEFLSAAIIQDQLAASFRSAIRSSFPSVQSFAAAAGLSEDLLYKLLGGRYLWRLEDLAITMRTFGPEAFPSWTSIAREMERTAEVQRNGKMKRTGLIVGKFAPAKSTSEEDEG